MRYRASWTLRDYVEQTAKPKLISPVVLLSWGLETHPVGSLTFRRVHDLTGKPDGGDILLVEQENGTMALVPITRGEGTSEIP